MRHWSHFTYNSTVGLATSTTREKILLLDSPRKKLPGPVPGTTWYQVLYLVWYYYYYYGTLYSLTSGEKKVLFDGRMSKIHVVSRNIMKVIL